MSRIRYQNFTVDELLNEYKKDPKFFEQWFMPMFSAKKDSSNKANLTSYYPVGNDEEQTKISIICNRLPISRVTKNQQNKNCFYVNFNLDEEYLLSHINPDPKKIENSTKKMKYAINNLKKFLKLQKYIFNAKKSVYLNAISKLKKRHSSKNARYSKPYDVYENDKTNKKYEQFTLKVYSDDKTGRITKTYGRGEPIEIIFDYLKANKQRNAETKKMPKVVARYKKKLLNNDNFQKFLTPGSLVRFKLSFSVAVTSQWISYKTEFNEFYVERNRHYVDTRTVVPTEFDTKDDKEFEMSEPENSEDEEGDKLQPPKISKPKPESEDDTPTPLKGLEEVKKPEKSKSSKKASKKVKKEEVKEEQEEDEEEEVEYVDPNEASQGSGSGSGSD